MRPSTFIEDLSGGLANRFAADIRFIPKKPNDDGQEDGDAKGSGMTGGQSAGVVWSVGGSCTHT